MVVSDLDTIGVRERRHLTGGTRGLRQPLRGSRDPSPERMVIEIEAVGGDVLVAGFRLQSLQLTGSSVDDALAAQVRMLTVLHDHRDVRFVWQFRAVPAADVVTGQVQVALLCAADHGDGSSLEAAVVDLERVLAGLDRWHRFERLDRDALHDEVVPFEPQDVALLARRRVVVGVEPNHRPLGFNTGAPDHEPEVTDSFALFGPENDGSRVLAETLVGQPEACLVRVIIQPCDVGVDEVAAVERHLGRWCGESSNASVQSATAAMRAIVAVAPAFEVYPIVASTGDRTRLLAAQIGAAVSPPQRHGHSDGVTAGGCDVVAPADLQHAGLLADAYERLSCPRGAVGHGSDNGSGPSELERLRFVLDPWELATTFSLPVATTFRGVRVDPVPLLDTPEEPLPTGSTRVGQLRGATRRVEIGIASDDRLRHTYVLGQTGTGKSTLLLNMVLQDIERGVGVGVIDPHGDLADDVMRRVPEDRIDDVVLIDPADPVAVVGVNLLEAETDVQAEYLVSDLCEFFQQLYDPQHAGIVGPRFQSWLRYAVQTLIPVPGQGTIADVARVFLDDRYLAQCLPHVTNPITRSFWFEEMAQTNANTKSEMLGWFASKFEAFRASKLMRRVLAQPTSTISFTDIMDSGKILLVQLSKGLMGEYNTSVMGYVMFAKIWAATLARATRPATERVPFHLYVDEFQTMTSPALPTMLAEARKFGLAVTVANQFFGQLRPGVRDALLGNVGSKITFRLGALDAEPFANWYGNQSMTAENLRRLPNHVAICSLLSGGEPLDPIAIDTLPPPPDPNGEARARAVRDRSRAQWARPCEVVDRAYERTYHS